MTKALRDALKVDDKPSHAGLLLTRYLKSHKPTDTVERNALANTPEEDLLNQAMKVQASDAYILAYDRWKKRFQEGRFVLAELASSLAIGLGNESPLEIGLTVSHTYGMPIIPGSAIKGMCRRGALKLLDENSILQADFFALFGLSKEDKISDEQYQRLMGESKHKGQRESAGIITFHNAWYDPKSVEGKPFHRDVITVHHQEYYGSKGKKAAPTDFDDPTPVPFLVVKPEAKFFFGIEAPDEGWAKFTIELLKWSLENMGIGGKTNSGYGYFKSGNQTNGASSVSLQAEIQTWENVIVKINPGTGDMLAQNDQQKRANVTGSQARGLRDKLPAEKLDELKSKRQIRANIKVEVSGNRFTIVEITPL